MKMKFGAIVTDGRGKIGGHVASKNRAGAYLRTKVTPVNPSTTSQVNVRNRLAGLAQAWRGLLPAQRLAWNNAVSDYKKTDIFGDIQSPTGFNLYVLINSNLLNILEAARTTPALPGSPLAMTSLSLTGDVSDAKITATFAPAIGALNKLLVRATPALSAGKSFVKSEFRQINILANADVSPKEQQTEWMAKFGSFPAAGTKIFFELVPILIATGQAGIPIQASAIVTT
jgi:hypothetical protein